MVEKIRDKYWDERRPGFDMDMLEVYIPEHDLDMFLRQHAKQYVKNSQVPTTEMLQDRKKHDKLMYKVFKAASIILTDRQFEIFVLRHKFFFKEIEIARQLNVNQSYVSNVLKASYLSIQVALRLKKRPPNKRRIQLCTSCSKIADACENCNKKIRLCDTCKEQIVKCSKCRNSFKYTPKKKRSRKGVSRGRKKGRGRRKKS